MDFFKKLFLTPEEAPTIKEKGLTENPEAPKAHLTRDELWHQLTICMSRVFLEDPGNHSLQRELAQLTSLRQIDNRILEIEGVLTHTNHALHQEVMQHYDKLGNLYTVKGMENISETAGLLVEAGNTAEAAKHGLLSLETSLLNSSFSIVKQHRRLLNLRQLKTELDYFAGICSSAVLSIKRELAHGDFYAALQLCISAENQLSEQDKEKFCALSQIGASTQENKAQILNCMQEGLALIPQCFEATLYERLVLGYSAALSADEVARKVHGAFLKSITKELKAALQQPLGANKAEDPLRSLTPQQFFESSQLIFKSFTNIMHNSHLLSKWHEEGDSGREGAFPVMRLSQDSSTIYAFCSKVKHDLLRNRKYIWDKMQKRVAATITGYPLFSLLKRSDVPQLLSWLNSFIMLGEEFSGNWSAELRAELLVKCQEHFTQFNTHEWSCVSELLDSEQWDRLPIPQDFDLTHSFVKGLRSESLEKPHATFSALVLHSRFEPLEHSHSPTHCTAEVPVISTVGMNIIKVAGKYMELLQALSPIAFEIFVALSKLVDFFIYWVILAFSDEAPLELLAVDCSWREFTVQDFDSAQFQSQFASIANFIAKTHDLMDSEKLPGCSSHEFPQFVVAVESIRQVLKTLKLARPVLEASLIPEHMRYVRSFFKKARGILRELSSFLAETFVPGLLNVDWLGTTVLSLQWNELLDDTNDYIHRLIHLYEDLSDRMDSMAGGSIPRELQQKYLTLAVAHGLKQLVAAFSLVPKCSAQGRAQMKTDLLGLLEGLAEYVDELPEWHCYQEYIEKWTGNAEVLCKWIAEHTEFPFALQKALLLSAPKVSSLNKRGKQQLLTSIEGHYYSVYSRNN